ncbi:hypothetical protein SPAR22_2152 [Streptococcus pneumoniae GA11304]|nr:hypothetical protein SPAR22_2152 [Streptococcus pneumoniae GA11304]
MLFSTLTIIQSFYVLSTTFSNFFIFSTYSKKSQNYTDSSIAH